MVRKSVAARVVLIVQLNPAVSSPRSLQPRDEGHFAAPSARLALQRVLWPSAAVQGLALLFRRRCCVHRLVLRRSSPYLYERRGSLRALAEPLDVERGVHVPVNCETTGGTVKYAFAETELLLDGAASRTGPTRVGRVHLSDDAPGTLSLDVEPVEETRPGGVVDRACEVPVNHLLDAEIFYNDRSVLGNEIAGNSDLVLSAHVGDALVATPEPLHGVLAPGTTLLTSRYSALRPLQLDASLGEGPRIFVDDSVGGRREMEQTEIDADCGAGRGERFLRNVHAGKGREPATATVAGQTHRLRHTFQRAVQADLDGAEERNSDAAPADEDRVLWTVGVAPEIVEEDRLPPASALETGKSGLLAGLAPTEESLECLVQSPQGSAQHGDRHSLELWVLRYFDPR